ncbi:MAG: DGQHR domain-containing protein [Chitinophagaceae bacterium]|nr:DGQHR domain-containing protein [Chitinophagaceae bacterium]
MSKTKKPLSIPCLKARMGDWIYYVGIMSFDDVAKRVSLPKEIDKKFKDPSLKLGDWIQRELDDKRTNTIVDYLIKQKQRFFNSLILGIYGGKPSWQELEIYKEKSNQSILEEETDLYFSKSIGVLRLDGSESIFAVDGQHRAFAIREAVAKDKTISKDEITVIFLAHKTSEEGKVRTRRLFSTLNRYAKPVSQSEIIALSEDNNCSIITRNIIESFELLKDKILVNKNRPISATNTNAFTNILTLYEIIECLLTNKKVYGFSVSGNPFKDYTTNRIEDSEILKDTLHVKKILKNILESIPSFNVYLKSGTVDRKSPKSNLVFRPIGQNILFDTYKVASEHHKTKELLQYISKDTFNLEHKVWKEVFWDKDTKNIITDIPRQRYATKLLLEYLGIPSKRTPKDLEMQAAFNFTKVDL